MMKHIRKFKSNLNHKLPLNKWKKVKEGELYKN